MIKTVVELDLVGFSTIGDNLEQGLDVGSAAQLNEQIQSFVDVGLNAVEALRDDHVMQTTGDGAILVFNAAADAHRFAQAVHEATREHNLARPMPLAKRVFRIGVATGEIVMRPKRSGGFDIAGSVIARAVRLEAKARPGGLLVDQETFEALGSEGQQLYGPKQMIPGKRDEVFAAHAWQPYVDGPKDAAFFIKQKQEAAPEPIARTFGIDQRREVLERFGRLKSHQYYDLIFLLEIPIDQRPSDTLSLVQQRSQILKWAEEDKRLDFLLDELRRMTELPDAVRPR
jgi:class 3 adenylate cyclase